MYNNIPTWLIQEGDSGYDTLATGVSLILLMIICFVLLLILCFYYYLFLGIGMYRIAKKHGFQKTWIAWIPIIQLSLLPLIVEENVKPFIRGHFTLIFWLSTIVSIFLGSMIPMAYIIPFIVFLYGFYTLTCIYSNRAILHLVVCVLTCGLSLPLQLIFMSQKEMK